MTVSDHFFSRWSRRKQEASKGLPLAEPAATTPKSDVASTQSVALERARSPHGENPVGGHTAPPNVPEATVTLPTLEDAKALTPQSDFGAFFKQGVPSDVRNLAVKKLFTDPHFNVMDGLDIYIGDYNTPDPLPPGMLAKMTSLSYMNPAASENPEVEPTLAQLSSGKDPSATVSDTSALPDVAKSPDPQATPDLQNTLATEHDDSDLQLQPNDAPAAPSAGSGAG